MKKSDLKNGMIVEYRGGKRRLVIGGHLLGIDTHNSLSYYNEDLTNKEFENLDIVNVYDGDIFGCNLKELLTTAELTLIWERKEVDWTKVEFGTKVRVWDIKDEKFEGRFISYDKKFEDYPFVVFVDNDKHVRWECCELA